MYKKKQFLMKINTFFGFLSKTPSVFQMPGRWHTGGRAGGLSSSGQASGAPYEESKPEECEYLSPTGPSDISALPLLSSQAPSAQQPLAQSLCTT